MSNSLGGLRFTTKRSARMPCQERDAKSPRPAARCRLLNSCDGGHMPVICPTCQFFPKKSLAVNTTIATRPRFALAKISSESDDANAQLNISHGRFTRHHLRRETATLGGYRPKGSERGGLPAQQGCNGQNQTLGKQKNSKHGVSVTRPGFGNRCCR